MRGWWIITVSTLAAHERTYKSSSSHQWEKCLEKALREVLGPLLWEIQSHHTQRSSEYISPIPSTLYTRLWSHISPSNAQLAGFWAPRPFWNDFLTWPSFSRPSRGQRSISKAERVVYTHAEQGLIEKQDGSSCSDDDQRLASKQWEHYSHARGRQQRLRDSD
jgi:hypothetical protein